MRKIFGKLNRSSKKGITLVELVVAITMTAIFAVACIALINPIERMYQGTVKLTKAQLLADTVVDAIRKECDDVKHDDKSTVWIANFNEGAADDSKLLSVGPDASLKSDEGNALIFQRNNNYTEAIYSCVPISAKNRDDVKDAANPIAGDKTGHSITALFGSDESNQNKGIVHFGYYQSKEDDRGVFPIRSYDYTNPVTASTYGNFTVKLEFSNLTLKDGKYPTYVNCKISVYEGLYTDAAVSLKGPVYTRSTVISFSANGSGKGSGGGYTPSTKKDITVRVRWVDEAGKKIGWPAEVPSVDITFNGSNPARKYTLNRASGKDSFTFSRVVVSGEETLTCQEVSDYICTYTGNVNRGYVVTYKQDNVKTVKLVSGKVFSSKIIGAADQNKIIGIKFGKKSDWIETINGYKANGDTVTGPFNVAIPYTAPAESEDKQDDYVLYKVLSKGEMTVYVLSNTGRFILNDSCEKMFINLKNMRSITGFAGPEDVNSVFSTELTTSMRCMFEGCESINFFNLSGFVTSKVKNTYGMFKNCTGIRSMDLSNWDTSGVTNMSYMFQNTKNPESDLTIDISSFDFNKSEAVDMSYMFYQSDAEKIKFPPVDVNNSAKKVSTIESMFNSCSKLTEIENFVIAKGSEEELSNLSLVQYDFSGATKANNLFSNCTSLENIGLSINLSSVTSITGMFTNCTGLRHLRLCVDLSSVTSIKQLIYNLPNLQSADLSKSNFAKLTSFDKFFNTLNALETVKMNDVVFSSFTGVSTTMFEDVYNLRHLEMQRADFSKVEDTRFITRDSLYLLDLSGAKFSSKTSCENMFKIINTQAGKIKQLQTIIMDGTELPKCTSYKNMFKNCHNLSSVIFKPINSSTVDCTGMFSTCEALTSINLSDWNKSKVSSMANMFENCTGLTGFNFSEFTVDTCTDASYMFKGCTGITAIQMSGFKANALTDCHGMFEGCSSLASADFSGFNAPALSNCSLFFQNCTALTSCDFGNVKLDSCTDISKMFSGCSALATVNMSRLITPNLTTCQGLFENCYMLDIGSDSFSEWDAHNVTDLSNMFKNCYKMGYKTNGEVTFGSSSKRLDLSSCTTMENAFNGCTSMKTLILDNIDLKNCNNFKGIYGDCPDFTDFKITNSNLIGITTLSFLFDVKNIDLSGSTLSFAKLEATFKDKNIESIILNGTHLPNCTSFKQMFYGCKKLKKVEMVGLDTPVLNDCLYMFQNCTYLETINAADFNTSNCTDMQYMFDGCNNVTSVNLSGWNTAKVKKMDYMFNNFAADVNGNRIHKVYITLDISDFSFNALETCGRMINTEATGGYNDYIEKIILPSKAENAVAHNLTDVNRMFRKRAHLKSIDNLGLLATSTQLTNTQSMFSECNMLAVIDISSMNLSSVTITQWMFNCASGKAPDRLTTIYVSSDPAFALTDKVKNSADMFTGRTILEGQNHTKISEIRSYDKTYARIDGYNDLKGYFSVKQQQTGG